MGGAERGAPAFAEVVEIGLARLDPVQHLVGEASRWIVTRSIGMPTPRLDRMVESIEIRPSFMASSRLVPNLMARSRMGLPYLCSPICRKGVSSVASMKLPWR